jgi:hypothetical protein
MSQQAWISMPGALVCGVVLLGGCKRAAHEQATYEQRITSSRGSAAAPSQTCVDPVEAVAIACSAGHARRAGDTLVVSVAAGREHRFVDVARSEAPTGYHYVGRVGRIPYDVVESYGGERPQTYLLLNERTGRSFTALDVYAFSPDTARVATMSESWDNCAEGGNSTIAIWQLADTMPILEWTVEPARCEHARGWGASKLHWRTPDTLELTRNDRIVKPGATRAIYTGVYRSKPMLVVRTSGVWRMIERN